MTRTRNQKSSKSAFRIYGSYSTSPVLHRGTVNRVHASERTGRKRSRRTERLVEETEAHILVRLLLDLLLLLGLGLLSSGSATSGSPSSSRGGSATTGSDVQQEVLDILSFESLLVPEVSAYKIPQQQHS